jgi:hypothetical protein
MTTKGRGPRRSPEKEAAWRKVVREWRQSGETALKFAEGRGLSAWTLRWWSSELKKRDAEKKGGGSAAGELRKAGRLSMPAVVPVRIAGATPRQGRRGTPTWSGRPLGAGTVCAERRAAAELVGNVIEIVPFGQVRIRLAADVDAGALRVLLDVLEARC